MERGCFVTLLKSRSHWNFLDIVNTWIEALCYQEEKRKHTSFDMAHFFALFYPDSLHCFQIKVRRSLATRHVAIYLWKWPQITALLCLTMPNNPPSLSSFSPTQRPHFKCDITDLSFQSRLQKREKRFSARKWNFDKAIKILNIFFRISNDSHTRS